MGQPADAWPPGWPELPPRLVQILENGEVNGIHFQSGCHSIGHLTRVWHGDVQYPGAFIQADEASQAGNPGRAGTKRPRAGSSTIKTGKLSSGAGQTPSEPGSGAGQARQTQLAAGAAAAAASANLRELRRSAYMAQRATQARAAPVRLGWLAGGDFMASNGIKLAKFDTPCMFAAQSKCTNSACPYDHDLIRWPCPGHFSEQVRRFAQQWQVAQDRLPVVSVCPHGPKCKFHHSELSKRDMAALERQAVSLLTARRFEQAEASDTAAAAAVAVAEPAEAAAES